MAAIRFICIALLVLAVATSMMVEATATAECNANQITYTPLPNGNCKRCTCPAGVWDCKEIQESC